MPTARNNQRRRRVVLDEVANADSASSDSQAALDCECDETIRPRQVYYDGARRRFQLRTTDLLPKRRFTLFAVISLIFSALFGIVLLNGYAPQWEPVIGASGVQAFTIGSPASLSAWFSSFILILTALGSLQVYFLRQHRCDDYRGMYRWWLWLALILVLASINCVAGVIPIAATAVGHLFKSTENFTTGWGWILIKFSVLALLVGRFAFEMRHSRGALAGCAAVFLAYCGALLAQYSPLSPELSEQYQLTQGNFLLLAKINIFSVVLIYGRFVYLEAHGLVANTKLKKKPERDSAIARWKSNWAVRRTEAAKRREEKQRQQETNREAKAQRKTDKAQRKIDAAAEREANARRKQEAALKREAKDVTGEKSSAASNNRIKKRNTTPAAREKSSATSGSRSGKSSRSAKTTRSAKPAATQSDNESVKSKRRKTKPRFSSIEETRSSGDRDIIELEEEIASLESKTLNKAERRRLRKLQRRRQAA